MSAPALLSAQEKLEAARVHLAACEATEREANRAAYSAQEATTAAQDEVAVAMVAAGVVPSRFRLADSARLWRALRAREGVQTGGARYSGGESPGPGFMCLLVGLSEYWIPCRHYWAWSEEVEAKRKAGK